MEDISTDHNHTTDTTMTGAATVTEHTHHIPHPSTTAACATLWLTETLIATLAKAYPTGIVELHLKHATSSTNITHTTISQTLTTQHEDHSQ